MGSSRKTRTTDPEVPLMVLDDIVARIPGGEVRATVGGAPGSFHGLPEVMV